MQEPDETGSRALLDAARAGSREALAALLERHLPGLRAFARLHLGARLRGLESESDVVQSVCADLLRDLQGVEYRGEAEFRGWLHAAVLNKLRNQQRRFSAQKRDAGRGVAQPFDELDVTASWNALCSPSHQAIRREQVERLELALAGLPAHYREVLTLAKIAGLSHEQIAARMQRTVPATRNLLVRALSRLAGELARSAGVGLHGEGSSPDGAGGR
jgi:RNA polymerase sigma-70 factor (ECF subfamily)